MIVWECQLRKQSQQQLDSIFLMLKDWICKEGVHHEHDIS